MLGLAPLLLPIGAQADPYYNSSEPGCDGSDPNVVFCEDFEVSGEANFPDGHWYGENCDVANDNGGIGAQTKGWCGSIYAEPITPDGAGVCGPGTTPFGDCVGTAGTKTDTSARNMALRHLKTPVCGASGSEQCGVDTLYVRWYAKWLEGYQFGAEKHLAFTTDTADIAFGNVQLNCGAGRASPDATPYIQIIHGEDLCQSPNVSDIVINSGRWYFFEMRVTAHPTDGVVQLWINDCGPAGTTCGDAPILRTELMEIELPGNVNGDQIETIWLESWANPISTGTGPYWDNLRASLVGPIGFGAGGVANPPPASPTQLRAE